MIYYYLKQSIFPIFLCNIARNLLLRMLDIVEKKKKITFQLKLK